MPTLRHLLSDFCPKSPDTVRPKSDSFKELTDSIKEWTDSVVEKGEARLVTHAFVRPGRSRDFVRHVGCVSPELVRAVIAAHGSVERVPVEKGMDGDALSATCAQLCRVVVLDAD